MNPKTASLLAAAILLAASSAWAAPVIQDVHGEAHRDAELRLSGEGFGKKDKPEPVSFDDFELGIPGRPLRRARVGAGWDFLLNGSHTQEPIYSDADNPPGSALTARVRWKRGEQTICSFGFAGGMKSEQVYLYYKRRMKPSACPIEKANVKQFYFYGTAADDFPQGMLAVNSGAKTWMYYDNSGSPKHILYNKRGWDFAQTCGNWQNWEVFNKLNTPGVSNGVVRVWLDGELGIHSDDYLQRKNNQVFDDFRIGHMYQMNAEAGGAEWEAFAYYDDVYVDTTPQRVVLGDRPAMEASTRREIQIARAWSDGNITIWFRPGGFRVGERAYLFVVDEENRASGGFPVVIRPGAAAARPSGLLPPAAAPAR